MALPDPPNPAWKQAKSLEITTDELAAALPPAYHRLVAMQDEDVKKFNEAQSQLGKIRDQIRSRMYHLRRKMISRRVRMDEIKRDVKKEIIRKRYVEIQKQIGL